MTQNFIQISAVIPVYNCAHLLGRAIESIINQTYPPAEIVVVDDGSEDNPRAVVESFDTPIRFIRQDNKGIAGALNRLMHEARSPWVAILDSDDYWDPGHLQRIAAAIQATEGAGNFYFADSLLPPQRGDGRIWEISGLKFDKPFKLLPDGSEWVLMPRQPMLNPSTVFKRSAVLESGGYFEKLPTRSDTHMYFKLGLNRPICAVQGLGAIVTTDNENRATRRKRGVDWAKLRVTLYSDLLQNLPDIKANQRKVLEYHLALAYKDLAVHAWKEGHRAEAMRLGIQCVHYDPGYLVLHPHVRKKPRSASPESAS